MEKSGHPAKSSIEWAERSIMRKVSTIGAGKTTFLSSVQLLLMVLSETFFTSTLIMSPASFAI